MAEQDHNTKSQQASSGRKGNVLFPERGDFLLSSNAVPSVDDIVAKDIQTGKSRFHPGNLRNYLTFLELAILNERLIIGSYDVFADLDPVIKKSKAFPDIFTLYSLKGALDLKEEMLKKLTEPKILLEARMALEDSSPQNYIDKYLSLSDALRKDFERVRAFAARSEKDEAVIDKLALTEMNLRVGVPIYLSEFALRAQLPYLLDSREVSAVSSIENLEVGLRRSVTTHLWERLNEGARKELKRIAELGERTVFPETPISWQIVMESSRPEDFPVVALQLRDEYKNFRNHMIQLETELLSEDVSLQTKLELQRQVDGLASSLWTSNPSGIRKEATELSGLLNILPLGTVSIGGMTKLVQYILAKPSDLVLKFMRRRKVRVLLKAKRSFLKGKGWSTKLAELFDLPHSMIRNALSSRR